MKTGELIGSIAAGLGLIVPAIKWLINDWAKKAEQLEELKKKHTTQALNRLGEDIKSFRSAIDTIQNSIRTLDASLLQNRADVGSLKERFEDLKKSLDMYRHNFDSSLKNLIKSEIIDLTKQARLIREKKNGGG